MSLPQKRRFELPSDEELAQLNELPTSVPRVASLRTRSAPVLSATAETTSDVSTATTTVSTSPPTTSVVDSTNVPRVAAVRTNATSHSFTSAYERTIKVNRNQNGNPVLKLIRNVPWKFEDGVVPDYVVGE